MELIELAELHLKAFRYSKGIPKEHEEYLVRSYRSGKITVGDLLVEGKTLVSDADAGELLRRALENRHRGRYLYYSQTGRLEEVLVAQIDEPRIEALSGILSQLELREYSPPVPS